MFCSSCWANLPDGTEVCTKCGADLVDIEGASGPSREESGSEDERPKIQTAAADQPRRAPLKRSPTLTYLLFAIFLITSLVAVYVIKTRKPVIIYEDVVIERPAPKRAAPRTEVPSYVPKTPVVSFQRPDDAEDGIVKEVLYYLSEGAFERAVSLAANVTDAPRDKREYMAGKFAEAADGEYKDKNYSDAELLYEAAVELDDRQSYVEWLAYMKFKLEDYDGAVDTLEGRTLDADNSKMLAEAYAAIGSKHFFEGRTEEAIEAYEKGLKRSPNDERILRSLSELKRQYSAEEDFTDKEGFHFLVKFESGENSVTGNVIALLLEEAYLKIGADLDFYPEEMMTAVLYGGEEFRDVTRSPAWAGAIYDGRIKLPVGGVTERTELLEKVLFHEYTHALVHRLARGRVPVWLNEGLAEYEDGTTTEEYAEYLKAWAESGNINLRALEGSFMRLRGDQVGAAYLLSLSAVEYLINEFGIFSVSSILEGLGEGKGLDEAIRDSIFISYEDLEKNWILSLKR